MADNSYITTTAVLVSMLLYGCYANTNSTNTTSSESTLLLSNTSMSSVTPPANTSTTFTPTSTQLSTSQTTEFDLEAVTQANQVSVKFYTLKLSKFKEDEYSKLLAEKVTEYCEQFLTECKLLQKIVFESKNVINSNIRPSARNLELSTVVVYMNGTRNYILPKHSLATILKQSRESFRQTVGRDMIEIGGESFPVAADERSNVVISLIMAFATLVLLVAALLLRHNRNKIENENRKQLILRQLKQKEQDGRTYKIRPGPEPIFRHLSTRRSVVRKTSTEVTTTAAATGDQLATKNNDVEQGGYTNLAADFSHRVKLQPLLVEEDSMQHEKKKKKKKKRKRKEREENNADELD